MRMYHRAEEKKVLRTTALHALQEIKENFFLLSNEEYQWHIAQEILLQKRRVAEYPTVRIVTSKFLQKSTN